MVEVAAREQRRQEQLCPALVQSQPVLGAAYSFCPFAGLYLHTVEKVDRLNTTSMSKIKHKVQQVYITREQF